MKFADLFMLTLGTLRSNRLRSGITLAIIALGIGALMGIITAVQAMNEKLMESFSSMGASGFVIRSREPVRRVEEGQNLQVRRKSAKRQPASNIRPISLQEAEAFRHRYQYPATVALSCAAGNRLQVSTPFKKTTPAVALMGGDENYLSVNGNEIASGRNFTTQEVLAGARVCILGYAVATTLFGSDLSVVPGREVRIGPAFYRVVGVAKSRGSTFGFSRDNLALIPYRSLVQYFSFSSFSIGIRAPQVTRMAMAMGEAEGTFRKVRKLGIAEPNNFRMEHSDNLAVKAINSLHYLSAAVIIIGLITLTGAAIGLMNIMLVAVAERTKEVGLIKAVGGRNAAIRNQFLLEAILLSLAGSLIGLVLGVLLGNGFSFFLHTRFVVPWNWVVYGIGLCLTVGISAGMYPALKAANLDPIRTLRYE